MCACCDLYCLPLTTPLLVAEAAEDSRTVSNPGNCACRGGDQLAHLRGVLTARLAISVVLYLAGGRMEGQDYKTFPRVLQTCCENDHGACRIG